MQATGERELRRRVAVFDRGEWASLIQDYRRTHTPLARKTVNEEKRIAKAIQLIHEGELSHAARVLQSMELAPGTEATYAELCDEILRPQNPAEPLPDGLPEFAPARPVDLDKRVFGDVLRQSRRGQSSGLLGSRYEYYKVCLEDDAAFNALYAVA